MNEFKAKAEESIFTQKIVNDDFVPIQSCPLETIEKVIEHRRSPLYDELSLELLVNELPEIKSSQSPILLEENFVLDDTFITPESDDKIEQSPSPSGL